MSRTRSRVTAVAATVLVLALAALSAIVWTSPDVSPVQQTIRAAEKVQEAADAAHERERLMARIDALEAQVGSLTEGKVDAEQQLASSDGALQAALKELAILQNSERSATAPLETAPAPAPAPQPAAAPVTAPSKAELLSPSAMYYGMYTEQAPHNWATLDATSQKVGALPSMVGYFGGWDQDFRADAVTRSWSRGMLPMLTWESRPIAAQNDVVDEPDYSLPRIIGGAFDDYLHRYAQAIASTGLPLAIRLDHEMNGVWYPWSETDGSGASINGNSPGDYVKMWQHVHDIFEQEGANEYVIWVWAPNRVDNLPSANRGLAFTEQLYPGDDYVDWIGMSGYLRPPYTSTSSYTFDTTFGATLAQLRQVADKPIVLAEVGASETEGHKPEWVASFFDGLADPANDDIVGFAWFSLAVTTYVQGERATNDWRIDSRADSLAAFQNGLAELGDDVQTQPLG
ncbi:glycoside hydrolase family 26 protein [Protaetiibacter mangrovi]|uniref:glycoside hydrolase family 26 protein n=1 Tax=Protaetiibacter mangrovi TaxID=2970926 RepID=UPI0021612F0E|nr:glycosyl hydrolase [Protaetiibacter mangrovi]